MSLLFPLVYFLFVFQCSSPQERGGVEEALSSIDGEEVIPLKYRSIYIHHFDNRTFQADLVRRLRDRLQVTYQLDGRLKVAREKDEADLWLYGTVESYQENPVSFDNVGQPTQFWLTLIVSIRQRVNHLKFSELGEAESILLENRTIRFDTSWTPRLPPFESQFNAQERLILGISERILKTSFEGWYSDLKTPRELNYDRYEALKQAERERVVPKDLPREQRQEILQRIKQYEEEAKNRRPPQDDLAPPPPGLRRSRKEDPQPPSTNP
ncbi:MAG: LPS assembly lipoprotein LptE [Leptospiraceae bacterium]|nr:LPS assembly lipoprotein LptE [Leptospiraceae bacterium]MDW8305712.1 LPS assembly lipoprotein LptE [Leptospiraceae bacterium]